MSNVEDKLRLDQMPEAAGVVLPPTCACVIDFDDFVAPSAFIDTVRLTSRYQDMGVTFEGPGGNDGGAILDVIAGGFGVTGQSGLNTIAFNLDATLMDGGIATGPETILFDPAVEHVQINAGHRLGGTVTLECFDNSSYSIGVSVISSAANLETMTVSGSTISYCTVSFTGEVLVLDDLAFCQTKATDTKSPKNSKGSKGPKSSKASHERE